MNFLYLFAEILVLVITFWPMIRFLQREKHIYWKISSALMLNGILLYSACEAIEILHILPYPRISHDLSGVAVLMFGVPLASVLIRQNMARRQGRNAQATVSQVASICTEHNAADADDKTRLEICPAAIANLPNRAKGNDDREPAMLGVGQNSIGA